jgi:FkbM family methyltransferase
MWFSPEPVVYHPVQGTTLSTAAQLPARFCLSYWSAAKLLGKMRQFLKTLARQLLPHGICEYSFRRHDYVRMGLGRSRANWLALSRRQYQRVCDARLNFLPKEITSSLRTCVDAGANEGNWTEALLSVFAPERVIAVECEPRLVGPLRTRLSSFPCVEVVDAALAESDGTATFHQLRHPAGSSLLKPRTDIVREFAANSWDVIAEVSVKKISYDQLVAKEAEVSILKIDIQGAEMEVLSNSREGLQRTKSVIMEVTFTPHYENDAGFPELHHLMAQKGFGLYRLSLPYDRGARALYADAVYVREDILQKLTPVSA